MMYLTSFKPYYKWNTFNTCGHCSCDENEQEVLNLIINGIPSIPENMSTPLRAFIVLNLIINGIPSILNVELADIIGNTFSFKPYYKWNTFNTRKGDC